MIIGWVVPKERAIYIVFMFVMYLINEVNNSIFSFLLCINHVLKLMKLINHFFLLKNDRDKVVVLMCLTVLLMEMDIFCPHLLCIHDFSTYVLCLNLNLIMQICKIERKAIIWNPTTPGFSFFFFFFFLFVFYHYHYHWAKLIFLLENDKVVVLSWI